MDAISPWNLLGNAPSPFGDQGAFGLISDPAGEPAPPRADQPHVAPLSFTRQILLGLAIFAAVLAISVPLTFVSEGLALGSAVGAGGVLIGVLARRLRIALMLATLLAVLGAFAASHAIELSRYAPADAVRFAALAPAAGLEAPAIRTGLALAATVTPVRAQFDGVPSRLAVWAFPAALFALWVGGFAALRLNHMLARWLLRVAGRWLATKGA